MHKLFLSLRYLRTRKIVFLCVAGVMVGVMALIVVTSVMEGFGQTLQGHIRGVSSHMKITTVFSPPPYIGAHKRIIERIEKIDGVVAASPRIEWPILLGEEGRVRGGQRGFMLIGVDPEREPRVSDFQDNLVDYKEDPFKYRGNHERTTGAIVGVELLGRYLPGEKENPFYEEGERVNLITFKVRPGSAVEPWALKERSVYVSNRFYSGYYEYDSSYIYTTLEDAQDLLGLAEEKSVTSIAIKLKDYTKAEEIRSQIYDALEEVNPNYPAVYQVLTWEQEKANFLQAVKIEKAVTSIIIFFIVIVAGFNLMAILTMLVAEKTRDIGIMAALGASRRGIAQIFMTEGIVIGVLGNLFGVPLGLLLAYNLNAINDWSAEYVGVELFPKNVYYLESVPVVIDYNSIYVIVAATMITCVVFAVFPARRAAKLNPMEALRYE